MNEKDTLDSLKIDNVVRVLDCFQTQNNLYLISEFCEGGDLRNLISKGPLSEK